MLTATALHIAFDDVGDGGPALLYMPGWCGHRTMFRGVLSHSGPHRRALALDWRGHGGSDRPDGDYGNDDLVEDALAVIERADVDQVVPVGVAHAGWVAIELRRRLGADRVPGIALLDWMVLGPPPPFLDALEGLQDEGSWEAVRQGLFAMWTTGIDLPALDDNIAEMAGHGFEDWSRAGREIARQFRTYGSPVQALEHLHPECPVVHLYAQPSDEGFLAAQSFYAASHPWFRVQRLDATSHFPMLEVPGDITAALDEFVRSLGR
jgi:pimeloyl-ACP methyl ester carboxylesterase